MYPPLGCEPEFLGTVVSLLTNKPTGPWRPPRYTCMFILKLIELFQALEKAQSDFDRLQEKLERCQNDSRRVSQFCPSCLSFEIFKNIVHPGANPIKIFTP